MLVYGRIPMKTELVNVVVSGVWLMNCFGRSRCRLIDLNNTRDQIS